ncbi:hypothetical protein MTR_1g023880 [Medicago truncatula]|uniref:Uncharacterized protein n=1 Tax=Medicago truncatula TaxID=3880 RepID=G7I6I0_MEDTR|nr:hypothetical protein MTR_1g023880 [Medicago truncatula]
MRQSGNLRRSSIDVCLSIFAIKWAAGIQVCKGQYHDIETGANPSGRYDLKTGLKIVLEKNLWKES